MNLVNKVAVITGAGKGLGKETAKILAKEGCKVIICSRNKEDLSKVQKEIIDTDGVSEYFTVDVTNQKEVDSFIDMIMKKHKRIDIIVNNAGYVNDWKTLEKTTTEELEKSFETNIYSIFYFLRKVVPIMRKQNEGSIINISSMAGKRGIPNLAVYSASKFAVIGFTQAVAKELEGSNVSCITVCPGGMNTSMRSKVFGDMDSKKQQSPEFVANVIKDILIGNVKVPNGGDIIVRHGKITEINQRPD